MTPKEKAEELINKYSIYVVMWAGGIEVTRENVKQCALIAVDELIKQNGELYLNGLDSKYYREKNAYLFEVKQEIENL